MQLEKQCSTKAPLQHAAVQAQDLGPYPSPAPSFTVLSSVNGGHAWAGRETGGGGAPADPAAQEEMFVDASGTSAVWRSLGGQMVHRSFRSVVLGPNATVEGGLRGGGGGDGYSGGHGAIAQVVRCRFPTRLDGWSSSLAGRKEGAEERQRRRRSRVSRRGPWSVCLLRNPDLLTVHHPDGNSHDVTLPFEARSMLSLGEGLLVQRSSDGDSEVDGDDGRFSRGVAGGGGGRYEEDGAEEGSDSLLALPSLFSLQHPLDELRPVALLPPAVTLDRSTETSTAVATVTQPDPSGAEAEQPRLFCDASERLVFVRGGSDLGADGGSDASLVLTYHSERRRHSLWLVLPVPEPEPEQEPENESSEELGAFFPSFGSGVDDVSMLGQVGDHPPSVMDSWPATTGISLSTLGPDVGSLSSTLLGVSALDSSSSAAGLSVADAAVFGSGLSRRDRRSVGGGGSMGRGGGAGRRASSGSNVSWIGAGNTRNEVLANALGLGQSGLGVASNMLSLSSAGGQHGGGGDRMVGTDTFLPGLLGGKRLGGASVMALGEPQTLEEQQEEGRDMEDDAVDEEESQPIRPRLGLSLVWTEVEDAPATAESVFCAAAVAFPGLVPAEDGGFSSRRDHFLLCFSDSRSGKLRALSVSVVGVADRGEEERGVADFVRVVEAFTLPCRSAVGLCATSSGEGEGSTPGAAIAADILILAPGGDLMLYRGKVPVVRVAVPAASFSTGSTAIGGGTADGGDEYECISDAVGSCFTLTTRGGERRRLRLSLDPASTLVATCCGAWDCLLSASLSASLRTDVACTAQALAGSWERHHAESSGRGRIDGDLEWAALVSVLRSLILGDVEEEGNTYIPSAAAPGDEACGRDGGTHVAREGGDRGRGGDGDRGHAWASLLSSPFHDRFSRDNAVLVSGFTRSVDGAGTEPRAPPHEPPPRRAPPLPLPRLQTERAAFLDEAGIAFDALHLALEELKTSRLCLALVPRLASLLLSITRVCGRRGAEMRDFADHYWRDAAGSSKGGCGEPGSMIARGHVVTSILPGRPTRFLKVPCIRRWVHARVRTGKVSTIDIDPADEDPESATAAKRIARVTPRYEGEAGPFPTLPRRHGALQRTRRFCRFYTILCGAGGSSTYRGGKSSSGADWVGARLVKAMVEEGYRSSERLDEVPLGLSLPLLELLHAARGQAPSDWPAAAQELVDRQDLSALCRMLVEGDRVNEKEGEEGMGVVGGGAGECWSGARISSSASVGKTSAGGRISWRHGGGEGEMSRGGGGGGRGGGASVGDGGGGGSSGEGVDLDGLTWVDELSSLRFGRDRRVREACRLLRGSRPVRFHVERSPESSDHDHQQRQQARLLQLAMRTLAGPTGRGMLTLATLVPLLAEPLPIPPLCLAGRIRKPADVVINLDLTAAALSPDTTAWSEFHNGVAAGLRLQHDWGGGGGHGCGTYATAVDGGTSETGGVSRTWITYNRPASGANNAHGGLLMALGLEGHLSSLAMTDVYEYLTLGQESTTVGVLLGMAAARRGSADISTHKMLCLHIPSLLPHPFADMDTSSVTQAAALAGVGLLYQGTSHRLMTEFLLEEMGRSPSSDRFADREGYALACGLSLGMINLGKGASRGMAGVADLKLEQQLHRYMSGGKDPAVPVAAGDGIGRDSSAARWSGSGRAGGGRGSSGSGGAGGGGSGNSGGGGGGSNGNESSGPSRISPGEYVNIDVTAPAALVALALIHVRSGDESLAARLSLPQTHFQLDYARPEQLLLRVLVRGLVMWDHVHPTEEWVESQIPSVVRDEYARLHEPLPEELATVVDRQTVRQAHANILAGACLCLGLRFAGTADERARVTVLGRVRHFKSLRESLGGPGSGGAGRDRRLIARRPERPVLEMCLSAAVTSLGIIMAGTGDLECFRVMRELRGRVEGEVTYGTHMAISMGIGMLFLGGGMASLGRENEHIAALLAAFFPRYPASPDDNQYHLQALRHLYVLAVQRRGIDAVDVDTGESLFVPVSVTLRESSPRHRSGKRRAAATAAPSPAPATGGHGAAAAAAVAEAKEEASGTLSMVTPCILPDLKKVSRLAVRSPRYFPVELDIAGNPALASALRRNCRIYVKRRVGHLSYKNDPHALRSLLFQSYPGPMSSSSPRSAMSVHHGHHGHNNGHHGHSIAAAAVGEDPVQSKADFLSTFTEDPHLLNFARYFCDSGGGGKGWEEGGREGSAISAGRRLMLGTEALGDASALARFFGGALLECLSSEKAEALGPHLSLCHSAVTARHTADASAAWELRLVLDYGRGSKLQLALAAAASSKLASATVSGVAGVPGGHGNGLSGRRELEATKQAKEEAELLLPEPFPLLHPDLLASLEVRLDSFFASTGFDVDGGVRGGHTNDTASMARRDPETMFETEKKNVGRGGNEQRHDCSHSRLWRYLYGGEEETCYKYGSRENRLFGAYLAYFGIPAPVALEQALGGRRRVQPAGLGLVDAPALVRGLPGLMPSALLKITSPATAAAAPDFGGASC